MAVAHSVALRGQFKRMPYNSEVHYHLHSVPVRAGWLLLLVFWYVLAIALSNVLMPGNLSAGMLAIQYAKRNMSTQRLASVLFCFYAVY